MKPLSFRSDRPSEAALRKLSLCAVLVLFLVINSCSTKQNYTEYIDNGVRYIHNLEPRWGSEPKIELKFVSKYGDINSDDERYLLLRPADVDVDDEGSVLILDAGNHMVKKYDRDGSYLSSFGQKGIGPGEFIGATQMEICPNGDIVINDLAVRAINIFDRAGHFVRRINHEGLPPTQILALGSGEVAAFYQRIVGSGADLKNRSLVNIFNKEGNLRREFVAPRIYADPPTNFWCNSIFLAADDFDNIYVNFESQNRIEKYSASGELLFSADRRLEYPETQEIEKKQYMYDEGPLIAVSFNVFSAGIQTDSEGRIWSGTLIRQKNPKDKASSQEGRREGGRPEDYMLEVFDSDGILLGRIQKDFYYGQRFRIKGDRFFLVDRDVEMAVYEYKIMEK
jgi:hypothetical protein